jgi:hypothetical protein
MQGVSRVIYKEPPMGQPAIYKPPTWATMKDGVVVLFYHKRLDQLTHEEMQRFIKHLERLSHHLQFDSVLKYSALRNIGADRFTPDDILVIKQAMSDHLKLAKDALIARFPAVVKKNLVPRFMSAEEQAVNLAFAILGHPRLGAAAAGRVLGHETTSLVLAKLAEQRY